MPSPFRTLSKKIKKTFSPVTHTPSHKETTTEDEGVPVLGVATAARMYRGSATLKTIKKRNGSPNSHRPSRAPTPSSTCSFVDEHFNVLSTPTDQQLSTAIFPSRSRSPTPPSPLTHSLLGIRFNRLKKSQSTASRPLSPASVYTTISSTDSASIAPAPIAPIPWPPPCCAIPVSIYHCLRDCNHIVCTSTPSSCGSNCARSKTNVPAREQPSFIILDSAFACPICIDELLAQKTQKQRERFADLMEKSRTSLTEEQVRKLWEAREERWMEERRRNEGALRGLGRECEGVVFER